MIDPKIVRNYATCLFENIKSDKDRELVLGQISLFNEVLVTSALAHFALCSPVISNFDKLKLIEVLGKIFQFKEIVSQFFVIIVKNSRFKIFSSIVEEYKQLLTTSRGIKSVIVESANKLGSKELAIVQKYLENTLKQIVEINVLENKSLIGGIVIKHDSLLYDYSVSGEIDRIAQLAHGTKI